MPKNPRSYEKTRHIALSGLLFALALALSFLESGLSGWVPIPGIKLGLANIVTVYAMFVLGPRDTLLILLSRIFLGAVFSGQMAPKVLFLLMDQPESATYMAS